MLKKLKLTTDEETVLTMFLFVIGGLGYGLLLILIRHFLN